MAGNNNNDVLIVDLCRTNGKVSRVTKQYELGSRPAMLNSLGCNPVVSVEDTAGSVLQRVTNNGGILQSVLLPSGDGGSRAEPGPSSHVYAIPTSVGAVSTPNPFPLAKASYTGSHTFGTDIWYTESGGGFQTLHNTGHEYVGFGGAQQPYWVLKLPPAREFNGVPSGRLENHIYDNYILMPVVSFHCEPLSLRWNAVLSQYEWILGDNSALIVTNQVGGGGTGERWTLQIRWNEVRPCFLTGYTHPFSAVNAGDSVANGAGLSRSYTYRLLEADVQVPDFAGSVVKSYGYAQGDFRDPLIAYSASSNEPASWSIDFEGIAPTSSAPVLPTPQKNPFDPPFTTTFRTYDGCHRYAIPTKTAQDLGLGDGPRVYLEFDLNITGGFSKTGFIEFVKDSLATQTAWNNTPRYYEMIFNFIHETGLP
jgi:hypothetical protein